MTAAGGAPLLRHQVLMLLCVQMCFHPQCTRGRMIPARLLNCVSKTSAGRDREVTAGKILSLAKTEDKQQL